MTDAPANQRPVTATYRLQLHAGFTFADAADIVPYLSTLGVSHLYLSPILSAVPGSMHCYDVIDHSSINAELGGEAELKALAHTCHEAGLGIVVDVVPNHMAFEAPLWRNAQVWSVLREGQHSAFAHWFDVDWDALDGKFGIPVLGEPLSEVLAAGQLSVDTGRPDEGPAAGRPVLRYYDHVFPLAEGTTGVGWNPQAAEGQAEPDVGAVLEQQHYVLASWREADEVLNYRRFFEVDTLIGVRVEESDVFEATHRLLLDLHHSGVIDGFRIDHPDGLFDPSGYLHTLAGHLRPGTPVWVEKILEHDEQLPTQWECSGTTGYDALAALSLALTDPNTPQVVSRAWARIGGTPDLDDVVESTKRNTVEELLGPEVNRLVRLAEQVMPDRPREDLREALGQLLVNLHAYRAYVRPGEEPAPDAADRLAEAVDRATTAAPDLKDVIRDLGDVLADPDAGVHDPAAARDLCVRFQQTTGPVMAKSIEDTAFYRWHRLIALNEVGVNPANGANPQMRTLHEWARHQQARWPMGMTTLSTHDTKRSEDVRARVLAVAGDEQAWIECGRAANEAREEHGIDGSVAHLIWQTLVGVGPISSGRLAEFVTKAIREAKLHTSWVNTEPDYEGRVLACAEQMRTSGEVYDAINDAVERSEHQMVALVLAQKVLQLTLPGVPDTYQGTEVLDLSLVDPDNRRPVDYARRRTALARIDEGQDPSGLSEMKLLVTARTLRLRRRMPDVFGPRGSYRALNAGPHLLGHVRSERVAALALRAPHAVSVDTLSGHRVELAAGRWVDELTGRELLIEESGLELTEAFLDAPVALLVAQVEAGEA
ncbi:MAG: malto-oligosyltrehalose synthase [Ornithinimicrobium sp.]